MRLKRDLISPAGGRSKLPLATTPARIPPPPPTTIPTPIQLQQQHPHTLQPSTRRGKIAKMADDDSSDLSSLSSLSPVPSDVESEAEPEPATKGDIRKFFPKLAKGKKATVATKEPSPPPRKRSPSPPHENAFIDNPDIAVCTLSRRFAQKKRVEPRAPRHRTS